MADMAALESLRSARFFEDWDGEVAADHVMSSELNIKRLIDELMALGAGMTEESARQTVFDLVQRFNEMNEDGWINTMERDDIFEQVGRVIDACGFTYDEDWLAERDW